MSSCFCDWVYPNLDTSGKAWEILPEGVEFTPHTNGWKCPVCGRGNAPSRLECACYREKKKNGRFKS